MERRAVQAELYAKKVRARASKVREEHAKAEGLLMHYENNRPKWGVNPHNDTVLETPGLLGLLVSTCEGWDHGGALLKRIFVVGQLGCGVLNRLHDTCKSMASAIRTLAPEVVCKRCRRTLRPCMHVSALCENSL